MEESNKSEKKKISFDTEFRAFVHQAVETINVKYEKQIKMGETIDDLFCLNNYFTIYHKMNTASEHFQYFEIVYAVNRSNILNCLNEIDWIFNKDIYIQFGGNNQLSKAAQEKTKKIRINISNIFSIASDLKIEAELLYKDYDEKFIEGEAAKDLIRFDILLLHLMRIFYYLNDTNDKVSLLKIVNTLEEKVGTNVRTKEEVIQPPNPSVAAGEAAKGGIGQLIGLATGIMKKMGYEPPANMVTPTDDQVFNAIETIVGNPTTQNAIHGMMNNLNGCKDVGEAIRTVVGGITDPNTLSALQGTVEQTAKVAASNNSNNNTSPDINQSTNNTSPQ